jgi:GH25 family lysozyme M1 (1,4-beta-N-acetylmuramidase)
MRHIARWTVAGQLEAEKFLRRVNGSRELVEPAYEMNPNLNARQGVA